jgi:hypothetical protein
MNEDFATNAWTDNHPRFSENISSVVRTIMDAMKVLQAKQYDAPWRKPQTRGGCKTC